MEQALASPCLMTKHCYWKVATSKNFRKVHRRGNSVEKLSVQINKGSRGQMAFWFIPVFGLHGFWCRLDLNVLKALWLPLFQQTKQCVLLSCIGRRSCMSSLIVRRMVVVVFSLFLVFTLYSSNVTYNDNES